MSRKKQAEAKRRSENPYDNDLLNELHHEGAPSKMLDKMRGGTMAFEQQLRP